jgi:ABC-type transport system substrate-binding protein
MKLMNRLSISSSAAFILALFMIFSSGCGKESPSESKTTQTTPATPTLKAEEYHTLDPANSGFSIGFKSSGRVEWDSDGLISGEIDSLFCVDQDGRQVPIELSSNTVSQGNAQTVRFGIIKLKSAGGFSSTCLIKDSQIAQIQAFLKSAKTDVTK